MIAPNMGPYTPEGTTLHEMFQTKTLSGQELYQQVLDELGKLGPFREVKKSLSISLENRKPFASVIIRNRSIKLVIRAERKINSPRFFSRNRISDKIFDHTILIETKSDIDEELIAWLGEAYQAGK